MKELIQKIKLLYEKIKTRNLSYDKDGIKSTHDWRVLLVATFILFVSITIAELYFYEQINQGKLFVVRKDDSKKYVTINSDLLNKTVNDIKQRESSLNSLKQNKGIPNDPSL